MANDPVDDSDDLASDPADQGSNLSPQEIEEQMEEYRRASPDLYYTHSGRLGFAVPVILMAGLPAIAALAALYAYIVVYCPVVGYVNLLFTGGFVIGIGFIVSFLGRLGHCRNRGLMALMGLICGVFALSIAWLFFIKALLGRQGDVVPMLDLILNPSGVAQMVMAINNEGWWEPSGIVQWILSGIEAVLVVGGSTMIAAEAIGSEVFCEDCGKWCDVTDKMLLEPTDAMMAMGIEHVEPEHFLKLAEADETDYPRLDAEVMNCPQCQSLQAIRFQIVSQELDDGELKENREQLPKVLIQRS